MRVEGIATRLKELSERIYKSATELRYLLIWSVAVIIWLASLLFLSKYYTTLKGEEFYLSLSAIENIPSFIMEKWFAIGGVLGVIGFVWVFSNIRMIRILEEFKKTYFANMYVSVWESIMPSYRTKNYFSSLLRGFKFIFPIQKFKKIYIPTRDTCLASVESETGDFIIFIKRIKEKVDDEKLDKIRTEVRSLMKLHEKIKAYLTANWVRIIVIAPEFDEFALNFAEKEEDYIFDLIEERKGKYYVTYVGKDAL